MTQARRSSKVTGFTLDPGLPGPAAAASLALPLLRKTKLNTWADLAAALAEGDPRVLGVLAGLHLDSAQLAVLAQHPLALGLVRLNPTVSVAVCPVCGEWFALEGAAPASCPMTFGCRGKPVKAAAAKQREVDMADLDQDEGPSLPGEAADDQDDPGELVDFDF